MKEAFSLRTMHKKIVMLSKLAGIILIFSYILSAGLPVSEDLAFLIWLFFILLLIFNSRPHAEVDRGTALYRLTCGTFQLTTSRRGRLLKRIAEKTNRIFQLTTSRRGRLRMN